MKLLDRVLKMAGFIIACYLTGAIILWLLGQIASRL